MPEIMSSVLILYKTSTLLMMPNFNSLAKNSGMKVLLATSDVKISG